MDNFWHWRTNMFLVAVADGRLELLKDLNKDYPVNQRDRMDRTALHIAIENLKDQNQCYVICKLLLDNGADVNVQDYQKASPLHYLLDKKIGGKIHDDGKLLDLLISKGADYSSETQEEEGRRPESPLFKAIDANNIPAVNKLLELGAQLNRRCCGEVLVSLIQADNEVMFKLLLRYDVEVNDYRMIHEATFFNRGKYLRFIVEDRGELNLKTIVNYNPGCSVAETLRKLLYEAINNGCTDVLEILLENGAGLNNKIEFCKAEFMNYLTLIVKLTRGTTSEYGAKHAGLLPIIERLTKIFIKQIVIVEELENDDFGDAIAHAIGGDFKTELEVLRNQMKLMKMSPLYENSEIVYFDIFTRKGNSLVDCFDTQNIPTLTEDEVRAVYPDFADTLVRNLRNGISHRIAREDYKKMLFDIFKPKLTFDLVCCICNYLKARDLTAFRFRNIDS